MILSIKKEAHMLKRHQVLLADWQTDYIRHIAKKYDVSFSEVVRGALSIGFIHAISSVYPEYKNQLGKKEILEAVNKTANSTNEVEVHKFLSSLYFEARKAAEHSLGKNK